MARAASSVSSVSVRIGILPPVQVVNGGEVWILLHSFTHRIGLKGVTGWLNWAVMSN